jgi:hypothetical protein
MNYKKKPALAVAASLILILVFASCAVVLGASNSPESTVTPDGAKSLLGTAYFPKNEWNHRQLA